MDKFKESIKVTSETVQRLNSIDKAYQMSGRKLKFRDKIATAVYIAILDIDTESENERLEKLEFLNGINKIICNYEYFRPIVSEYVENKKFSNIFEK